MSKIYDCITFFNENLLVNARFEILSDVVDFFIICESKYDHSGNKKKLNFNLINKKFQDKIKYTIIENNFPQPIKPWTNERIQREKLIESLKFADKDDYIMYSDADEIPNPDLLKDINLKKKYGIFLQKNFVYKINIFNSYESPWEGTRICKKKNLKSIFHLRKKILLKNAKKPFWKFYKEKDISIFENGGWHFNNLYDNKTLSNKLKVSPHKEYSSEKFSSPKIIKKKIDNLKDLYERGHTYQKVDLNSSYPEYILNNKGLFKDFIL
jgi:beta-1,4-mannosyl-glycoprotein beta-1,4-N-acetylglucosaminyltransferase